MRSRVLARFAPLMPSEYVCPQESCFWCMMSSHADCAAQPRGRILWLLVIHRHLVPKTKINGNPTVQLPAYCILRAGSV